MSTSKGTLGGRILLLLLLTNLFAGIRAEAADRYEIDPLHTYVGFRVQHFGLVDMVLSAWLPSSKLSLEPQKHSAPTESAAEIESGSAPGVPATGRAIVASRDPGRATATSGMGGATQNVPDPLDALLQFLQLGMQRIGLGVGKLDVTQHLLRQVIPGRGKQPIEAIQLADAPGVLERLHQAPEDLRNDLLDLLLVEDGLVVHDLGEGLQLDELESLEWLRNLVLGDADENGADLPGLCEVLPQSPGLPENVLGADAARREEGALIKVLVRADREAILLYVG